MASFESNDKPTNQVDEAPANNVIMQDENVTETDFGVENSENMHENSNYDSDSFYEAIEDFEKYDFLLTNDPTAFHTYYSSLNDQEKLNHLTVRLEVYINFDFLSVNGYCFPFTLEFVLRLNDEDRTSMFVIANEVPPDPRGFMELISGPSIRPKIIRIKECIERLLQNGRVGF